MIEAPPTEKEGQTETQRRERFLYFKFHNFVDYRIIGVNRYRKTLFQRGHFCMFSVIFFLLLT